MNITGINYEGGKIIQHVMKSEHCIAYANIQIAMDAPYDGRVADETVRNKGRSELQFHAKYNYSDEMVIKNMRDIIRYIVETYPDKRLVMQIARGRAAVSMVEEVVKPALGDAIHITQIIHGYRSVDYFDISNVDYDFVFINVGMFAVLGTESYKVPVGTICNPRITYNVDNMDMHISNRQCFDDNRNVLNVFCAPRMTLYGIDDNMPFITPDVYPAEHVMKLLL